MELLRKKKDVDAERDLPAPAGVNSAPYSGSSGELSQALESARALEACGVEFAHCEPGRVPWLVAVHPFRMAPYTREMVERLGAATFAFFDAVQMLYVDGDPVVRNHLDANLPPDLRGLQADRGIQTFRLDIVLRNGAPKITEVEEIYGNAGKMAALQRAYDVDYGELFRFFADLDFSAIYLDDTLQGYFSELDLVRRELAVNHGWHAPIGYFWQFAAQEGQTVWRFCKTKDLAQYAPELRAGITGAKCNYVNPLFQSYGTKAALALPFHPALRGKFESLLGAEQAGIIRSGFTRSRFLDENPDPAFVEELEAGHKSLVLKVVDCPGGLDFT